MMDRLRDIRCRWSADLCRASKAVERQNTNTAPDGQVLPDWLTWSSYETTIGDEVLQTGEILQLPLTYYGPSIPLGPDWTYGGLTSPAPREEPFSATTATAIDAPPPAETTGFPLADSSPSSLSSSVPEVTDSPSFSVPAAGSVPAGAEETPAIRTGAGPASIPTITSTPSFPAPSVIVPATDSLSRDTSALTQSNVGSTSSSPSLVPTADQSQNDDLIPLLPAILIPLVTAILIILLVIWCYRRRERSQQGYTTALGASSGGYGGWLTSSFARRANGSGERFTSAWTQVSDTDVPTGSATGKKSKKGVSPVSPVSAAEWAKSNERSALLGFIPQHHRTSSSIDHNRLEGEATKGTDAVDEKKLEKTKEEEIEVLADRNRSLLGRLNLGLGWLSVASLSSARSGRVASGHTLERGNGGTGALGRPQSERGSGSGTGSNGQTGSGSGAQNTTTSDSAVAQAEVSNDQLFFRAPLDTASLTSSPSPRQGFFARWRAGSSSSKSKRSSGPSRSSWPSSHIVAEGDEDEPFNPTQEGISVAMPTTPSTLGDGERDKSKRATRWDSKERLKFPIPPPGRASSGERESLISSHNTEYQSAESHYSAASGPPTEHTPTPEPTADRGQPFDKNHVDYAPPSLSPFGSKESFAPTRITAGRTVAQTQNSGTSMRELFSTSPSGPARPSMDSGGEDRRSYVGQPIIDDTLLQAISTGRGTYAGLGGIDEFGQTVRAVSGEAPTIVSTARWSRSHESEMASYHSGPSTASSQSTAHREMLADNDEATIKSHALRGRRSQPQLILAPSLARLTPTPDSRASSDSESTAMAWTRRWGG